MELQDEDRPPEDIWLDSDALDEWFGAVKQRWNNKHGGEDIEEVPLDENELAKEWRRG